MLSERGQLCDWASREVLSAGGGRRAGLVKQPLGPERSTWCFAEAQSPCFRLCLDRTVKGPCSASVSVLSDGPGRRGHCNRRWPQGPGQLPAPPLLLLSHWDVLAVWTLGPDPLGSIPCPSTHQLCEPEESDSPPGASVSSSVKWKNHPPAARVPGGLNEMIQSSVWLMVVTK